MTLSWKKGAVLGAALLLLIQLVPVQRTNPAPLYEALVPDDVAEVLARACYDCHSNQTRWPWYSRVAPVSWWVVHHVNDGREDLNFSEWPVFDAELEALALKDIEKQVTKGAMPPRSYLLGHPAARLSADDRDRLLAWAKDR